MDTFRGKFEDISPQNHLNGFYRGVVVDTDDPLSRGRVRIRVFGVHTGKTDQNGSEGVPNDQLPWAEQVAPSMGGSSGFGSFSVPVQNSIVWCFFDKGNPYYPLYFGVQMGMTASGSGGGGGGNGEGGGGGEQSSVQDVPQGKDPTNIKGVCGAAEELNCDPCILWAIDQQESSGSANSTRFEPHKFKEYLEKRKHLSASQINELQKQYPKLIGPYYSTEKKKDGTCCKLYNNDRTDSGNMALYEQAKAIDPDLALAATSMGKYQTLGEWKTYGYNSADDYVAAIKDPNRQEEVLVAHIKYNKNYGLEGCKNMTDAMQKKNYEAIASYHNGTGWRTKNPNYASNIKKLTEQCNSQKKVNCSNQNSGENSQTTNP